jgi:hypothetical protein
MAGTRVRPHERAGVTGREEREEGGRAHVAELPAHGVGGALAEARRAHAAPAPAAEDL